MTSTLFPKVAYITGGDSLVYGSESDRYATAPPILNA